MSKLVATASPEWSALGPLIHDIRAALAYRREISLITAARPLEDQEELGRGVLRQDAGGQWVWKMDPAYIERRVKRGARLSDVVARFGEAPVPTLVIWGTESDAVGGPARRMAQTLPNGKLVPVPVSAPDLDRTGSISAIEQVLGG